ncbi:hypothetical protein [Rugamonas apoptosis]|uniref:Secretion system X translation initiation factor n=1 Tax=Rugamonas apoptosis TaxID=2758570 RepID=A0A7W2FE16_9BURK|nr:hypothetical protein [Rugamonas apoptosis]MBA5689980.1 hypothetical protein [Rugamonas apoptosis]
MDRRARFRWGILSTALLATMVAAWMPAGDPLSPVSAAMPVKSRVALAAPAVSFADRAASEKTEDGVGDDPFAPRGWQAPASVPIQSSSAPPMTVAPIDLAPAGPPELPYRFVGSMNDNAEQMIYLARGEQAYVARPGETLDGIYKVIAVTAAQVEFEHLPTGVRQALVFPAQQN